MKHGFISALLLFIVTFTLTSETIAQIRQTHRYEREQKSNEDYYTVISLKEEGLALLRKKDDFEGNRRAWELVLLDTACRQKSIVTYHVEDRYPMIGYEVTPGLLYLLYRTGETMRNSLMLVEINTADGKEASRHDIKPEVDFKITHFSKVGSSLVLGGYVGSDPTILLYNLEAKIIKAVPGFLINESELMELRVNQNQTFNVVLIDRSQRSERKMIFKTFDESGKLLLEDIVQVDEDISPQTSISSNLEREELMVFGTWGERQGRQSHGFYVLPIDPFSDQAINYLYFGQLTHFLDYLNPKRAQRVKTSTQKYLEEGRTPSFVSYVIPYRVHEHEGGYLLLAEIYNPLSNSTNSYYTTPYGSPYYTSPYYYSSPYWPGYFPGMRYRPYSYRPNTSNPDKMKTYASVLLAFDPKGNILWDQSIKLENIEKTSLEQVVDFYYSGSKVVLIYKHESDLNVKLIDTAADTAVHAIEKIKLHEPSDEIRNENEDDTGVRHWTGNTFYVWGYQTIRNLDLKEDRIRDVFYINKIIVP